MERCQSLPFRSVRDQLADASAIPFEDGSFDAVIAMHMLYHLPDPTKGIAGMYRVLKPGGFLGFCRKLGFYLSLLASSR